MKLYNVRYFKGDEVRTISKHLTKDKAINTARKFIDVLVRRHDESGKPVIVETRDIDLSTHIMTMMTLVEAKTNFEGDHDPVGEGVSISLIDENRKRLKEMTNISL